MFRVHREGEISSGLLLGRRAATQHRRLPDGLEGGAMTITVYQTAKAEAKRAGRAAAESGLGRDARPFRVGDYLRVLWLKEFNNWNYENDPCTAHLQTAKEANAGVPAGTFKGRR